MKLKNISKSNKKRLFVTGIVLSTIVFALMIFHKPIEEKIEIIFDNTDEIIEKEGDSKNSEQTSVSFKTQYVINSQNPDLQLINPKGNTVNMQYTISIDNKKIYETNLVPPNKAKNVNMKELLEVGNYKVNVYIKTYDIETNKQCNPIPVNGIKVKVE